MKHLLFSVPMDINEQVAVIYCGVRGHLDKIDPAKVTDFEKAFVAHMRSNHQDIIDDIKATGQLTEANEAKLKDVVVSFVSTFA